MAWSTQQLADLAGVTVKAIRHYHRIGLLDEPVRASNGYKQYRTAHLVRLLRIKRMTDLGASLHQISVMDEQDSGDAARVLDAELADQIEDLQRKRDALAVLQKHDVRLDTPPPFGPVARELKERDRALIAIYARVLNEEQLDDMRRLMSERGGDKDEEFDNLAADADDATIEEIAAYLAVMMTGHNERYPWMRDLRSASLHPRQFTDDVVIPAVGELYNRAQLKALARATVLMEEAAARPG